MPIWSQGCKAPVEMPTASHSGADSVTFVRNHSQSKAGCYPLLRRRCFREESLSCGLTKRTGLTKRRSGSFQKRSNRDFDPYFFEIQLSSGSRLFWWSSTSRKRSHSIPRRAFHDRRGSLIIGAQYEATFITVMIKTATDCFSTLLPEVILLTWFSGFDLN